MKTLRKYLSLLLCLCVSTYALPVFASTATVKDHYVKIELSDTAMAQAVGGNGNVDATMSEYKNGVASAVIANRSSLQTNYTLSVIDTNGGVVETLASGVLDTDQAMVVSGTPTDQNGAWVQVRVWNSGVPGLEAVDTSVAGSN